MTKRCDQCRSFCPLDSGEMPAHVAEQSPGRCRRYPPVLVPVMGAAYHKSEGRPLSWNRTAPFPPGVEFKTEALSKLREQIVPEMIEFRTDPGTEFAPAIHRAILRVI